MVTEDLRKAVYVLARDMDPDTGLTAHSEVIKALGYLSIVNDYAQNTSKKVIGPFLADGEGSIEEDMVIENSQSVNAILDYGEAWQRGQALGHVKRRANVPNL